jgi:hypothetical protein
LVGGNRIEILKVLLLLKTLPAIFASGKSDAPVIQSLDFQPLEIKAVKGLFVTLFAP